MSFGRAATVDSKITETIASYQLTKPGLMDIIKVYDWFSCTTLLITINVLANWPLSRYYWKDFIKMHSKLIATASFRLNSKHIETSKFVTIIWLVIGLGPILAASVLDQILKWFESFPQIACNHLLCNQFTDSAWSRVKKSTETSFVHWNLRQCQREGHQFGSFSLLQEILKSTGNVTT